jgi:pilus assembly protein Flp/PilA
MLNKIKNLVSEEHGQGMTEYGLLLAAVIVIVVVALVAFKTQLTTLFETVADRITNSLASL